MQKFANMDDLKKKHPEIHETLVSTSASSTLGVVKGAAHRIARGKAISTGVWSALEALTKQRLRDLGKKNLPKKGEVVRYLEVVVDGVWRDQHNTMNLEFSAPSLGVRGRVAGWENRNVEAAAAANGWDLRATEKTRDERKAFQITIKRGVVVWAKEEALFFVIDATRAKSGRTRVPAPLKRPILQVAFPPSAPKFRGPRAEQAADLVHAEPQAMSSSEAPQAQAEAQPPTTTPSGAKLPDFTDWKSGFKL